PPFWVLAVVVTRIAWYLISKDPSCGPTPGLIAPRATALPLAHWSALTLRVTPGLTPPPPVGSNTTVESRVLVSSDSRTGRRCRSRCHRATGARLVRSNRLIAELLAWCHPP